jgi:hypothetical protein
MRTERTQLNKIRNQNGEITRITKEIKVIIKDYFENL